MRTTFARLTMAAGTVAALGASALVAAPQEGSAAAGFEIGRTPFYGPVPTLDEHSRSAFWYGLLDQAKVDQLKAYDLVVLEPTLRVLNVEDDHFYFENVTTTEVQEIKRGIDGQLGTDDDVIVLGYVSVGEMLPTIIPGHSGHMTVQKGIELGLLPDGYSGPSGPLHGPNPWNFDSSGNYVDVEGGATPDGTYDDGYDGYADLSIADDYSPWGNRLEWQNQGLMPWYLDQQGTWVDDERYLYGGYWRDGDGTADVNPTYGGGYVNGGDPAWQRFVTYRVDKIIHDGEYDGVFLDTVDTPDPVGGAGPSTSWGPRGNFGFTAGGMIELVEKIKEVDPSKVVAANRGYWYFNPDEGTSQFADRYRHGINIFVTESWYYNAYIPGFYDTSPGFEDNWNTDPTSATYRSRDNFGGFWKDYMNQHADQADGFNIVIIDFLVPAGAGTDKWMTEVVDNSGHLAYDVAGATHFNSAIYDTAKDWLEAHGRAAPGQAGVHPIDLHDGFVVDGDFSEWTGQTPVFSDPSGDNGKAITGVYVEFVGDKVYMMVEADQPLNLAQEMIYFDYDQNGPEGWQVFWPVSPDSRIYVENLNQTYLLPHVDGQGDVFRFSSPSSPANRGWPVRMEQSGSRAELVFARDYVFPDGMAGTEVWTWFRVADFGGESVSFTVPGAAPTGPEISGIQVSGISDTSATVSWTTDRPADSVVEYGATPAYGASATDSADVTAHSVGLTGLEPGTTYHFRVNSTDPDGLSGSSGDRVFTTTSVTVPPVISDVQVSDIGTTEATITWSTNVAASSVVEYGETTSYGSSESEPGDVTDHSVTLDGLDPDTTYHFRVESSASGGTDLSGDRTFTTLAAPHTPAITVDGSAADWAGVPVLMSGSSSVGSVSVTNDESMLYLLAQGSGLDVFGQFYLNTDNDPGTGYAATGWSNPSGADFMLENANLYDHLGSGWSWASLGAVDFVRNSGVVEAAIPLSTLGLQAGDQITLGYLKNNSATERLPASAAGFPVVTL